MSFESIREPSSGLELTRVEPGRYWRGARDGDDAAMPRELPRHLVTISRPFYLGRFPVTQEQWQSVREDQPGRWDGSDRPVEGVDWTQASAFCAELDLRLPTEAEWEFAARAGDDGDPNIDEVAWHKGNAGAKTHAVGELAANAWGFHDLLGNVWEWCSDYYSEDIYQFFAEGVTDPEGPAAGSTRVARGGSVTNTPRRVRFAYRMFLDEASKAFNLGFRVAVDADVARAKGWTD